MAYIIIIIVVITNIIAITNTNISTMKLLVKKFLFANSISNSQYHGFPTDQKFMNYAFIDLFILLMSMVQIITYHQTCFY